jgi:N-acetylmuramoyl-L-alanine amidase-like protein
VGALDWMADALRGAGLTVVEYAGWRSRAASGSFTPRAVIWHHDASAPGPSAGIPDMIATQGNSSTPPPLSQIWVDTNGAWWLLASGRANHAGIGSGWGVVPANAGNQYAIGIETDHTTGENWPAAQVASLRLGTKVLLASMGASPANALCGHKEYAPGRKIDPDGMDMNIERQLVANATEDDLPTPNDVWMAPCSATDPATGKTETHPAVAWVTVMAYRVRSIEQGVASLAGRDPVDIDEEAVALNLAPFLIDALSGQVQTISDADMEKLAKVVNDDMARRAAS